MKKTITLIIIMVLFSLASVSGAATLIVTKENPIKVNEQEKSISVAAAVNGKYFYESTRHAVIFKDGKYGDKPIFKAFVDPKTFHDTLIKLGFKAGLLQNNA